jgi:hypothetical protein
LFRTEPIEQLKELTDPSPVSAFSVFGLRFEEGSDQQRELLGPVRVAVAEALNLVGASRPENDSHFDSIAP